MEEGNLMDRVPILLQRDLQYYQVNIDMKKYNVNSINVFDNQIFVIRNIKQFYKRVFVVALLVDVWIFLEMLHSLPLN